MLAKDTTPQHFYRISNANEHPGVYYVRTPVNAIAEFRCALRKRLNTLSAKELRELAVMDADCVGAGVAMVRHTRYHSHCFRRRVERGAWILVPLDAPVLEIKARPRNY